MSLGSSERITAAQAERFGQIKAGRCVACWKRGIVTIGCDAHHLLSGGRRIGHEASVALCVWHHRGHPFDGVTPPQMRFQYGPSLMDGSKAFRAAYGTDAELLELQERMLRGEA
ncbi:MAG: Ref family recombination enhancement nuclease [Lysobacterales bacterium]|jgi:hypothetical protein